MSHLIEEGRREAATARRCLQEVPQRRFCRGAWAMAALVDLARVEVRVSGVVAASIDTVWPTVRQFGSIPWVRAVGREAVSSALLPGCVENQVGTVRCLSLGHHKLIEQLTGLDDTRHSLSYKLISHPLNSNPFPGSFVNYAVSYRLLSVTLGNQVFCEIEGSFYTDHDQVQDMCARIENLYLAWMQGLNSFVALNQRTSVGPSIGQRSSTSQSAASYPLQQQPPMHTKSQPDLYSSKYSGPDSGGSTRGETVSALHAQMSQAPLHPNPNFLMQAPATRGLTAHHHALLHPPDLQQPHHLQQAQLQEQLLQQQQQLELNRPLSDQEAFGPMAATVASSQPQGFAEAQARLYPGVVGPHSASLPTPFASAPAQGADMLPPLTASDNPTSPTRLRPPKSQSSLDGHSGRHARRIVTDLLSSSGGGRTHYFGGDPRGNGASPHTAIRDLQSSGASTVGPGTLQPLGSADSLGTSPGHLGGRQNTDDLDSGFNTPTPTSQWASHRTNSGQQPMSR